MACFFSLICGLRDALVVNRKTQFRIICRKPLLLLRLRGIISCLWDQWTLGLINELAFVHWILLLGWYGFLGAMHNFRTIWVVINWGEWFGCSVSVRITTVDRWFVFVIAQADIVLHPACMVLPLQMVDLNFTTILGTKGYVRNLNITQRKIYCFLLLSCLSSRLVWCGWKCNGIEFACCATNIMGTTMLTTLPECCPIAIPSNDSTCNPSAIGRRTCLDLIRSTHGDNLHGTASCMRS